LASMVPGPALPRPPGTTMADLPAATAVAETLSVDLRRRGFWFVGPTIVYAFMQSVGLVDDHLPGCFLHDGSSS
ncbi:MAG: DNA-3-methyladenine glycosylase I, partial [Chloroflexi bacterium]|nr:DNA-3-methyladenine glycosylase I [Chloroflexota bacterium]